MFELSDEAFESIVGEGIDALPELYGNRLNNVVFVVEDEPTPAQRKKMKLKCHETLFGLYEGVPQTNRSTYSGVLPDKITIFKIPILAVSGSEEDVRKQVKRTVWHEVAHHFGLGHDEIHALERKIMN